MKKALKIIGASILAIGLLLLVMNLIVNRDIETEIIINAPKEKVWSILANHAAYPDWNPFIKNISGSTEEGEKLAVTIQNGGHEPMLFTPTVLVTKENQEFRWLGNFIIVGVFDGEHYFILEELSPNQTSFKQGENFTGILSGLFLSMIREDTKGGFVSMNEALKVEAEKN